MSIVRLPLETEETKTGKFDSRCGVGYSEHLYKEKQKVINSQYNSLIAKGARLPMLPYSVYSSKKVDKPGVYSKVTLSSGYVKYDQLCSYFSCIGGIAGMNYDSNKIKADALTSYYSSANQLKKANLATSFIELKESISMIGTSATKLANIYLSLKRGNFRRAFGLMDLKPQRRVPSHIRRKLGVRKVHEMQKLKRKEYLRTKRRKDYSKLASQASDTWLEVHFGWLPIVSDIYDISNAVTDVLYAKRPAVFRIHGYAKEAIEFTNPNPDHAKLSASGSYMCSITGVYTIGNESDFNRQTLGLANPAAAMWAAVPFSFVVDWVLPVSGYLEGLTAINGLKLLDSCRSTKLEYSMASNYSEVNINTDWNYVLTKEAYGAVSAQHFNREAPYTVSSPPLPTLNLGNMLDVWKVTTSVALMKSANSYH